MVPWLKNLYQQTPAAVQTLFCSFLLASFIWMRASESGRIIGVDTLMTLSLSFLLKGAMINM